MIRSFSAAQLRPLRRAVQPFGALHYEYDSENVVTATSPPQPNPTSVQQWRTSAPGPWLAYGNARPVTGEWGFGGQRDVRGLANGQGKSDTATRFTALGDFTVAVVFMALSDAGNSRMLCIRPGPYSGSTIDGTICDLVRLSTGALQWYSHPIVGGTIASGSGAAGALPVGTRHWAGVRRSGSTFTVLLDGAVVGTYTINGSITARSEAVSLICDPGIDSGSSVGCAVRAAYLWTSALTVATLHDWIRATFGTV